MSKFDSNVNLTLIFLGSAAAADELLHYFPMLAPKLSSLHIEFQLALKWAWRIWAKLY